MPAKTLDKSTTLRPFIRAGIDGGCVACLRPIADHVDARGQWLGCRGTREDVPLILIPDRRFMQDTADDIGPELHTAAPSRAPGRAARMPQERRTARRTTLTPTRSRRRSTLATGPQVVYIARYPVTARPIENLPPHDRKVYGLIARQRSKGASRPHLLEVLNAQKHTGRIDGAVRRLRLRKVIMVRPVETE